MHRLVLPREALEARLRYESERVALEEKEAAKLELPEMPRPWLHSTLLREEPFSELLIDYQGLRLATLADLPGGQSLRVVGIEEAQGVQLELPRAQFTRMVFDADGAGLVAHMELEVVPKGAIEVPRRLALPQSLHARFLIGREALRQEALEEVTPATERADADPEAGREIAP